MAARFIPLASADVDRVLPLMAQLYAHGESSFAPERHRQAIEKLLSEPEFGGVWMIDAENTLAGYLVILLGYSLEFGGQFGLLDELFIAETHRGTGISQDALAFAEEQCRARGWKALRLEVDIENLRAQSLYRRCGFQKHDRFPMTKWI